MFRMERKFHTIDKRCCATLGIATRDRKRDDPRMNLALSLSSSHLTERSTSVPRALCKTSRYCANRVEESARRWREGVYTVSLHRNDCANERNNNGPRERKLSNYWIRCPDSNTTPLLQAFPFLSTRRLRVRPTNTTVSQIESLCLEFLRGSMNLLPLHFFQGSEKTFFG